MLRPITYGIVLICVVFENFTYENVERSSGVALAGVSLTEVEPEIQVFLLCIKLN